jgi:hypothetical protein
MAKTKDMWAEAPVRNPVTRRALLGSGAALALSSAEAARAVESPYARWTHGPPTDPNWFPIAVWLQQPANARRFQAAGINLYVGLWQGPTEAQIAALREAKMPVICAPNEWGLAHRDAQTIVGWMHDDEPDNAQPVRDPKTGQQTWGPPVPPPKVVADYEALRKKDPTRPVFLNLGQGVANDEWIGRGPGAKREDYLTYEKGADILSFDVYPVAGLDKPKPEENLWYVARGVERLRSWSGGRKPVWNCIECTRIDNANRKPTPHQVRAEVWMSLIHGSRGLIYFVHQFAPTFIEAALLEDAEMLAEVTRLNREIHSLAAVLNSRTVEPGARVATSDPDAPVAAMLKRHDGATYLFTVGMKNRPTRAELAVPGIRGRLTAEVLGENRRLPVRDGRFSDEFAAYGVHLYRLRD